MVFVHNGRDIPIIIGENLVREGVKYGMLALESAFGLVVALSNVLVIVVLIAGRRTLMMNKFYIILANLIICTSLKACVELAFVIPYYALQDMYGYFSARYEQIVFNASVLADYGVLFFSVLIALNRLLAVSKSMNNWQAQGPTRDGWHTALSCMIVWFCTLVIPAVFYIFDCRYKYNQQAGLYSNECYATSNDPRLKLQYFFSVLLRCLIYLSYACTILVLALYLVILILLSKKRRMIQLGETRSTLSSTQLQIFWQSLLVFALYAASIFCIFALSFVKLDPDGSITSFDIAYAENLLNLSIAAVYPICFLVMSGEMRRILINLIVRRSALSSSVRVSSHTN